MANKILTHPRQFDNLPRSLKDQPRPILQNRLPFSVGLFIQYPDNPIGKPQ